MDDEDVTPTTKEKRIGEAKTRLNLAYRMTLSLGLSPDESAHIPDTVNQYMARSGYLLRTCDKCVRNYHMARKEFENDMTE